MYDERFVTPMRQELTRLGVEELRTAEEVDAKLKGAQGTTLVVVNSVCGCAARNARPAVAQAIQHPVKPDALTTVFAPVRVHSSQTKSPEVTLLQTLMVRSGIAAMKPSR